MGERPARGRRGGGQGESESKHRGAGGHANAGGAREVGGRAVIAGDSPRSAGGGVDGAGRAGGTLKASEGRRGGAQRTRAVGVGG